MIMPTMIPTNNFAHTIMDMFPSKGCPDATILFGLWI